MRGRSDEDTYNSSRERASLRANPYRVTGILHIGAGVVRAIRGEETGADAEVAVWTCLRDIRMANDEVVGMGN